MANGKGTYVSTNGFKYKGDFRDDQQDGQLEGQLVPKKNNP